MMKVRDVMRPARWTIGPGDSLGRAERDISRRRLHQLIVVDAGLADEKIGAPPIVAVTGSFDFGCVGQKCK